MKYRFVGFVGFSATSSAVPDSSDRASLPDTAVSSYVLVPKSAVFVSITACTRAVVW